MIITVLILLILLLGGIGFVFLRMSNNLLTGIRRIKNEGQITSGMLVNLREEIRRSASQVRASQATLYYAQIAYNMNGKDYTRELPIRSRSYNSWNKGMSLDVKYLPDEPEISLLPNESTASNMGTIMLVGALIMFAAAVAIVVIMAVFAPTGQLTAV